MEKKQEEKRKKKRQHKTMDKKVVKQNARSIEALGEGEKKTNQQKGSFPNIQRCCTKKQRVKSNQCTKKNDVTEEGKRKKKK